MVIFRNRNTNYLYLMMFNIVFIPYHCTNDVLLKFLGIHCSLIKNMTFLSSYERKEYLLPHPWCWRRKLEGGGGGGEFQILTSYSDVKRGNLSMDATPKQSAEAVWLSWIFESFFPTHFFYFSIILLEIQGLGIDRIEGGGSEGYNGWRGLECWIQNNVAHFYFQR